MTKAIGSIIVRQAAKDGEQGVSVTNLVRYYLATSAGSGVTTATSGWTTSPQSPTVTNKYLWTYDKTYFSNSTTSVTTPSITGVYGDTGVTGLSVRQTEWAEGFEYRNDSNLTSSPRYMDIVVVLSTSGLYTDAAGQKYTLYQAKAAHNGVTSAASNKPGSGANWQTYWDQLNQLKPIYTPFLLAQLIKAQLIDVDSLIAKNLEAKNSLGEIVAKIDGINNGAGFFAKGNIYWDSYGRLFRKSSEHIVWRNIYQEMLDANLNGADYNIDLEGGTFFNIQGGLSSEINMPNPNDSPNLQVEFYVYEPLTRVIIQYLHVKCLSVPIKKLNNSTNQYESIKITSVFPDKCYIESLDLGDNSYYWVAKGNFDFVVL